MVPGCGSELSRVRPNRLVWDLNARAELVSVCFWLFEMLRARNQLWFGGAPLDLGCSEHVLWGPKPRPVPLRIAAVASCNLAAERRRSPGLLWRFGGPSLPSSFSLWPCRSMS